MGSAVTLPSMNHFIVIICAFTVLMGCSPSRVSVVPIDPVQILKSQEIFEIRYNACGCIVDTPELDFEVKLGRRWTRVFIHLEEGELSDFHAFKSAFLQQPRSIMKIEGEFTGVFYRWMQGHRAPGVRFKKWIQDTPSPPS